MIRLYRIPLSTNVERVALAMAHKGLEVESVTVDADDRSPVERVSGQPLVPVIEDDGKVIAASPASLRHLEERYPDPPLFPADEARRAEVDVFLDWFDRTWKRPPNEIYVERNRSRPDLARIERLGRAMTGYLDVFEGMLAGRDHLMGEFSVVDCIVFPFVKFASIRVPDDPYLFHEILAEHQPLGGDHPRVAAWIGRMDERPRI